MRKSHIRDYATAAFQFYACAGSSEKYKADLWEKAIEQQHKCEGRGGISNPSEAAVMRAEQALEQAAADIHDIEAVERTIRILENTIGGYNIIKVLKMVYMADPHRDPERGEISERVHKAELNIPASEKTVYRWLSSARRIFADERGLRR